MAWRKLGFYSDKSSFAQLSSPKSLEECLNIYTRRENLGSGAKIRCNSCNINQESTKQLSFKKLPLVLCFHLKRFEQTSKTRKKISDYISFPYELNLLPYMSCNNSTTSSHSKNDSLYANIFDSLTSDSNANSSAALGSDSSKYVLFAVVNHQGTIDSGHYTCYIRLAGGQSTDSGSNSSVAPKERWVYCDDAALTLSSRETCLHSEAYLLFYHKKHLVFE